MLLDGALAELREGRRLLEGGVARSRDSLDGRDGRIGACWTVNEGLLLPLWQMSTLYRQRARRHVLEIRGRSAAIGRKDAL